MTDASVVQISVRRDISNDRTLRERIERADQILNEQVRSSQLNQELQSSGVSIQGEWRSVRDNAGQPLFELILLISNVPFSTRFSREELQDDSRLRFKLHGLWGDVLQDRSHRLLKQLLGSGGAQEGS